MLFTGYIRGDLWRAYASRPGEVGPHRIPLLILWYGTGSYVTKVTGRFRRVYSVMK